MNAPKAERALSLAEHLAAKALEGRFREFTLTAGTAIAESLWYRRYVKIG